MGKRKSVIWEPGARVIWPGYWDVHPPVGVGLKTPPPMVGRVGSFYEPDFWARSPAMDGDAAPSEARVRAHVDSLRAEGYLQGLVPFWSEDGKRGCMAPEADLVSAVEPQESPARDGEPDRKPARGAAPKTRPARAKKRPDAALPGCSDEWEEVPT